MASSVSQESANHWFWRGNLAKDCQTATLVTMPEDGTITQLDFRVAGLTNYKDPVYGSQSEPGYVVPAIWAASGGILTKGTARTLTKVGVSGTSSSAPWEKFSVTSLKVKKGTNILVGFWRPSGSTAYATQWPYRSGISGWTTYGHNLAGSTAGPVTFSANTTYSSQSLCFRMWYTPAAGGVKVWNGSNWTNATVKVWSGSAWFTGNVKVWDGAGWKG